MREWPPIPEERVLEWMALDHEAWMAALQERVRGLGPRTYDAAVLEHALAYPWARPEGSYVLRDGQLEVIEDLEPAARRAVVAELARDRHPLVAFGANGAPTRLESRFAAFSDPADRIVLVLTGHLHGVDVGAQASPTAFGTVPGALFASPGTAVRAAILWLTPRQLAELTMAELGYRLGRLERVRFEMDEAGVTVDEVFAYVSRIGALRLDGGPVALAAVPARGRTARAMTQRELLEVLGAVALGPSATAEDVVRRCIDDMPSLLRKIAPLTWPDAIRLPEEDWTPYPAAEELRRRRGA